MRAGAGTLFIRAAEWRSPASIAEGLQLGMRWPLMGHMLAVEAPVPGAGWPASPGARSR
jgi:hypothetical protein